MRSTYCLSANPVEAHKSLAGKVWQHIKALTVAGHRVDVTVKPATRSAVQNALLHAALTDISNQVDWHGKKLNVTVWKRLCMAAWLREKREQPMLIPALDGNGFDIIFEQTSKLTIAQCSELLEWCFAFGAEHGVKFRALDADR